MDNAALKLYARLREGKSTGNLKTSQNLKQLILYDSTDKEQRSYDFQQIFVTDTSQQGLFDRSVKPMLEHIQKGRDACFLAYGPTNSGKSYTILGEGSPDYHGIFPRSIDFFLKKSLKLAETPPVSVKVSFLELYENTLRDLGLAYADPHAADIFLCQNLEMSKTDGRFTVIGATETEISSVQQAQELVSKGLFLRTTHESRSGAYSSKAHTVIVIHLVQEPNIESSLYLVDLADSNYPTQDFAALSKFCSSATTPSERKLIQLIEPAKNTISLLINVNLSTELQQETLLSLSFAETCHDSMPEDTRKIKLLQNERAELKERLRNVQELQEQQLKAVSRMLRLGTDPELLISAPPGSKDLQELHLQKEAVLSIDVIVKKNRDLETKIEETGLVFEKITRIHYTNQETHNRKVLELKDALGRVEERVQEDKAHAKYTQNKCAEAKTEELRKMLVHSQHLLNEKSAILKKLPDSIRTQDTVSVEIDMKELAKKHIENEFNKKFREQEINHSKQFEEIHSKYKQILQGKEQTLKSMVSNFKTMGTARKQGISVLCAEMAGIFRIVQQQKRILENVKQGKYNRNHRPIQVPQELVPEFPDSSSFPRLFSTLIVPKLPSHSAQQLKAAPTQPRTEICHPAITRNIPSLSQDEAKDTLFTLREIYKVLNKEYEECKKHNGVLYEQEQELEAGINYVTQERDRYRELYMKEVSNKRVTLKKCK